MGGAPRATQVVRAPWVREAKKATNKLMGGRSELAEPSLAAALKSDERAEGFTPDYD